MRCPRTGDDYVGGRKWTVGAIAICDNNLWPRRKCCPRRFCNDCFNFDCLNASLKADKLGQDGGVIACAAAEMQNAIVSGHS